MGAFGTVRYMVYFVIELKSRAVEIAGIAVDPGEEWTKQVARHLTDPADGFLRGAKYPIHDRDPLFSKAFIAILKAGGEKSPAQSPNCKSFASYFTSFLLFAGIWKTEVLFELATLWFRWRLLARSLVQALVFVTVHVGSE